MLAAHSGGEDELRDFHLAAVILATALTAAAAEMTERGRSVNVWKKDGKAGWKCVVDIWNPEPPPPAAR